MGILLAATVLPVIAAVIVVGFRRPLHVLLPAFAAFVPYGSGLAVPGIPPRYGSVSSLLGFVLILALGWKLLTRRWPVGPVHASVPVWLLFLGVTGATLFWSLNPSETTTFFISLAAIVALYVLVRLSPVDAAAVSATETGILAGGAAGALYALFQFLTGTLPRDDAGTQRFGEDLTDPNHLAAALILPLTLAVHRGTRARSRPGRMLCLTIGALLLLAILLTASRGGLAAALVAVVILGLSGTGRDRRLALLAGGVVVAALAAAVAIAPGLVQNRLSSTDTNLRFDIWRVGAHACSEHCVAGSGWGTFGQAYADALPHVPNAEVSGRGKQFYEAHNNWVLAAVETGVLGVVLMTLGVVLAFREAARLPGPLRGPPVAALTALLLTSMLLSNLEFKYFWLVLVYVAMTSRSVRRAGGVPRDRKPTLPRPELSGEGVR